MSSDDMDLAFTYNADGLRFRKEIEDGNSFTYYYNGDKLTDLYINGQPLYHFTYDTLGRPATISDGTNLYYYILSLTGDVLYIREEDGTVAASYKYDAWGRVMSQGGFNSTLASFNPFRYRGYVYDEETGLYYLQSRYYDPQVGRFINGDGQLNTVSFQGYNIFIYCDNNNDNNKVKYVGRTNDPIRREKEHKKNPQKENNVNAIIELFNGVTEDAILYLIEW